MIDINTILDSTMEQAALYVPKIAYAVVILIIGLLIIKGIANLFKKVLKKQKVDVSLRGFLTSVVGVTLKILLIITVISMLGVQMTSFIAIIGAAGLAVGLALQGSLANFAGGVLILLFKPYKVGDYIEAQGHTGIVKNIQIFNTTLKTLDNKLVIIPNGPLSNGSVVNYTAEPIRRVDLTFGIGYDDDIGKAKKVLQKIIDSNKTILKEPESFVRVGELGASSVDFTVRAWGKTEDYWDIYFYMQESVKEEFDKNNISIPYPQTDVHMKN